MEIRVLVSLMLPLTISAFLRIPLVCALTAEHIVSDLQVELSSASEVVLTSNNAAYAAGNFTPRYNIAAPPSFSVTVKPSFAVDVQKVVRYVRMHNISFLATGGGHGYSTSLGRLQGAINIDLGAFKTIKIDVAAETMTVGGAVRSDQVARALQAAGMEITLGQCGCIGFPGATLGGGIGPYSGLHGPMSDSLRSVEIVTGNGELLNVSSTQHPDLFYALKGAGFNYGVATSLVYKIFPATNGGQAMLAQMIFPGAVNESVWGLARSFAGSQPKELAISLDARYFATMGGMVIIANFIYAGPQATGLRLIQSFLDLQPANLDISTVAWVDIPSKAFYGGIASGGCSPGAYYVPYTLNVYQVDVPNLVSVFNHLNSTLGANATLQGASIAWVQYSQYGFQLQNDNSSAWPYRDVVAFVQIDGVASDASQLSAVGKFGRKMRDMLQEGSGRDHLHVYVHFAHGDESPTAVYSAAKVAGLQRLKHVYDPSGLFSWYNPVRAT